MNTWSPKRRCLPCEGGIAALTTDKITKLLADVPGWTLADDGKEIARKFRFKDFGEALGFVNRVGGIAENEGHHPDIHWWWNIVELVLTTHAIKGLSENDFILAEEINAVSPALP